MSDPTPKPAPHPAAPGSPAQPPAHVQAPATAPEATPQSEPPAFATRDALNPGDRGWRPPLMPVTPPPIPANWQHRKKEEPS